MKKLILLAMLLCASAANADVRIMFSHQSVGRNIISDPERAEATNRATTEMRTLLNSNIAFWDHDYKDYWIGGVTNTIIDPAGDNWAIQSGFGNHREQVAAKVYMDHLLGNAFTSSADADGIAFRDSCLSRFDVVIIKPGYSDTHMYSTSSLVAYQTMLEDVGDWWETNAPDILLVVMAPSSLRHPDDYNGTHWDEGSAEANAALAVLEMAEYRELDIWLAGTWAYRNPNNRYFSTWSRCVELDGADDVKYFTKAAYRSSDHHLNIVGSDAIQAEFIDYIHELAAEVEKPNVSGVAGEITFGEVLTITGDNFGPEIGSKMVIYDGMESGLFNTNWTETGHLSIVDEARHSNSAKSGFLNYIGDDIENYSAGYFQKATQQTKWYISYWIALDQNWEFGTGFDPYKARSNIKMIRLHKPPYSGAVENVNFALNAFNGSAIFQHVDFTVDSENNHYVDGSGETDGGMLQIISSGPTLEWHHIEGVFEESDRDMANCTWRLYRDSLWRKDRTRGEYHAVTYDGDNTLGLTAHNVGWSSVWGQSGDTADNFYYIDDAHVQNTWQRVMLGDDPVLEQCTVAELQQVTSWSATSIVVSANTGDFADQASVYLFVVDDYGNASTGTALTISEEGGAGGPMVGPTNFVATSEGN